MREEEEDDERQNISRDGQKKKSEGMENLIIL